MTKKSIRVENQWLKPIMIFLLGLRFISQDQIQVQVTVYNITTTHTRKGFTSCSGKSSMIVDSGLNWPPSCQRLRLHYLVAPPCKASIPNCIQNSYFSSSHHLCIPASKKKDKGGEQRPQSFNDTSCQLQTALLLSSHLIQTAMCQS